MSKKIVYFLFIVIICALIGFTLAYVPISLFTYSKLMFNKDIFLNSTFWSLGIFLTLILLGANLYICVKYKFFSSQKLMTKNDRTESNLFDNQSFMSLDELYKTYGDYNFKNLKLEKNAHGYVINSYLKSKKEMYLSMIPNTHGLLVGTTGTGKSLYVAGSTIQANAVSLSKPSMIINDLAGELYIKHSKQLERNGYTVSVINLRDPRKSLSRYNPCSLIWDLFHQYHMNPTEPDILDRVAVYINELALIICPETKSNDVTWENGARGILIGCFWGMLEDSLIKEYNFTRDMFTITQVSNIINRQKQYLMDFLFNRPLSSKVFDYAGTINDNASEKTAAGYISHLVSSITLFLESGMQHITSETDIDISQISIKPTALFIIVPAETPSRSIIGTMIYTQLFNNFVFQATHNGKGTLDRTVYFLLDEFGNLPKIKDFTSWLTSSRKYGVFFLIMLQSVEQLDSLYGREQAKTICDNCPIQMYLGASSDNTVEYFQKKFGTYTALQRNKSLDTSSSNITDFKGQTSLTKKDLVTKSEMQQIQPGEMFSFVLRKKPLHTHLLPVFNTYVQKIFTLGSSKTAKQISKEYENKIYDLELRESILATANVPIENIDDTTEQSTSYGVDENLKFLKN